MPDSDDKLTPLPPGEAPPAPRHILRATKRPHSRIAARAHAAWLWLGERLRHVRWQGVARGAAWMGAGLGGAALLCIVAFFLALFIYSPDISFDHDLYAHNRPPAFTFKDTQGNTVGRTGAVTGDRLHLNDMPAYVPAAFLAMEDRRFYSHGGIDYRGLTRALIVDIKAGHVVQGGSTITQQVAKTVFLSPKRTISRKLEEMAVARAIESHLSKDEILELYLNRIYLGSGAYGVDGAARVYFGKSARQVTLAEAAMLASLTRAPSVFSPRRDLAKAQARASLVLQAMVETGAISEAQAAEARANPAGVIDQTRGAESNYFFDAAAEEAQRVVGSLSGDFTVITTMDPAMQAAANKMVAQALDGPGVRADATQAALVAMSTDGAVRALVGGRDYTESTFNRATHAHRQPGSAFKPFVYLAAFEGGLDPNTVREDKPIDIDGYAPTNYRGGYSGAMTLHRALVHSVNTVAVQVCDEIGPSHVAAVARRLGIESPLQAYDSLALGTSEVVPMELTAAYAAFPTGGLRVTPYMVLEVRDSRGQVLYRHRPAVMARVVDADKAQWMNAILYDVVQSGTGTAARVPGHEVAGKTGTTSDFKDAWFVGYSADLVTGVWVGNDDTAPMKHVTGGKLPAQIWAGFMRAALAHHKPLQLARNEPVATFDMFAADVWGDSGDDNVAFVSGDNPVATTAETDDNVTWQYQRVDEEDAAPAPAPTPALAREAAPPPSHAQAASVPRTGTRELPPRAEQDEDGDWVDGGGTAVAHEPPPRVNTTTNSDAVLHGDLDAQRREMIAHAPRADVNYQPHSEPRREPPPRDYRFEPPRRQYAPPPDAAIPPPNTPPPDQLQPDVSGGGE